MMWRSFTGFLAASRVLYGVSGYGTTVYIMESYCPATTTLTSGTTGPAGTPTGTPYLIYLIPQPAPQLPKRDTPISYLATDGTITPSASDAARYQFDDSGRLSTSGEYISTSGAAAYQDFAPSRVLSEILTTFSINNNSTLSWANGAFTPHNARFCSFNAVVRVVFSGDLPQGCNPVQLGVIEAGQVGQASSSASSITGASTNSPSSGSTISETPTIPQYPAPTTTGEPNCHDDSGFDGTVNSDYLILCNTDLPGYDLARVNAADLANCIEQCNSTPPEGDGSRCVAVEYDILATSESCALKYDVGPVNRGDNPFAQAAIVVNVDYAPHISFGSGSPSTTSITTPALNSPDISTQSLLQASSMTTMTTTTMTTATISPALLTSPQSQTTPQQSSDTSLLSVASSTIYSGHSISHSLTTTATFTTSSTSTSVQPPSIAHTTTTTAAGFPSSPSTSTASPSNSHPSSPLTTPSTTSLATITPPLSTTLSTSTSSTSTYICPAAPSASTECVPSSPTPLCYSYQQYPPPPINNSTSNYEIECATQFSGASLQYLITQSLADCIFWCQYANGLTPNSCVGVTYTNGVVTQGGPNNCVRYSSLACATRGNRATDSARILGGGSGYNAIADYVPGFNCPT